MFVLERSLSLALSQEGKYFQIRPVRNQAPRDNDGHISCWHFRMDGVSGASSFGAISRVPAKFEKRQRTGRTPRRWRASQNAQDREASWTAAALRRSRRDDNENDFKNQAV